MTAQFGRVLFELAQLCGAVVHSGSPSAITATTLADTREMPGYDDNHFIGRRVYIYEGAGIGQERVVTASTGSTALLTVATWGDNPVVDASRYCVLQPSWRVDDLRTAFKQALRERRRFHMRPINDEFIALLDSIYEYEIPAGFASISRLLYEDDGGTGIFNRPVPRDMWRIARDATRHIHFYELSHLEAPFVMTGRMLKVEGQKYEDEPDSDSDSIEIPVGNIMNLAAYYALSMARTRDPNANQGYGAAANIFYQRFLEGRGDDEVLMDPEAREVY